MDRRSRVARDPSFATSTAGRTVETSEYVPPGMVRRVEIVYRHLRPLLWRAAPDDCHYDAIVGLGAAAHVWIALGASPPLLRSAHPPVSRRPRYRHPPPARALRLRRGCRVPATGAWVKVEAKTKTYPVTGTTVGAAASDAGASLRIGPARRLRARDVECHLVVSGPDALDHARSPTLKSVPTSGPPHLKWRPPATADPALVHVGGAWEAMRRHERGHELNAIRVARADSGRVPGARITLDVYQAGVYGQTPPRAGKSATLGETGIVTTTTRRTTGLPKVWSSLRARQHARGTSDARSGHHVGADAPTRVARSVRPSRDYCRRAERGPQVVSWMAVSCQLTPIVDGADTSSIIRTIGRTRST